MSDDTMADVLKIIHFGSIGFLVLSFMFFGPDVSFIAVMILIFVAALIPGPLAEQMTFSVNVPILKLFLSWGPKETGGFMLMSLQFWFPALFPGYVLTEGAILTFMLVGFDMMGFKGIIAILIYAFAYGPITNVFEAVFVRWVRIYSGPAAESSVIASFEIFKNLMAGFNTALAIFGTLWVVIMVLHSINHPIPKIIAIIARVVVLFPIVLAPHFFPGPACFDAGTCQGFEDFCSNDIVKYTIGSLFCLAPEGAAFNNINIFGAEILGIYIALIMFALDIISLLTAPGILEQITDSFQGLGG